MKFAIAGSGAMGSRFGFMLHQAGNDVILIDKWDAHIQEIRQNGLTVNYNGTEKVVKIPIYRPNEVKGKVDVIFMFTKAMFLGEMLEDIQPIIKEDTQVVCLLNGIGHETVMKKYVSLENILIGVTIWTAGLIGPGKIDLEGTGSTEIQNFVPGGEEKAKEIVKVLEEAGLNGVYSENVKFSIWRKACVNGALNATCSLLDATLGEMFETDQAISITEKIVKEFVDVAAKQDVQLDFNDTVEYIVKSAKELGHHYPSMHQDLVQHHRLTEIDYINGAVARLAVEYGIEAPTNELITKFIHAKEQLLKVK
ncbi:ketopantoate reductase [Marinilactibacillus piezotolerans]|uniref:2-dehydropantoate 2-reductase n=1 Tax=Marinilactibacillus piezotolerans TaxID=258723 RepID=A0A1I4AKW2_9LACT|nr:2-dehydropantoate 2-reductase [Marinilactibacillus piezotolerans]SFK57108.1 ketopantoate reductase [Marinilactibacillus piezotolerans]